MSEAPSLFVWAMSFLALVFSLFVLLSPNPIVSAVALLGTLFSTAGIYFAMGNYFMGTVQILVYAGAIAVLFVFIVMLLDLGPSLLRFIPGRKLFLMISSLAVVLFASLLFFDLGPKLSMPTYAPLPMTAENISRHFVSKYHVAFQLAGLLIFGAILGAVVLARGHLSKENKNTGAKT